MHTLHLQFYIHFTQWGFYMSQMIIPKEHCSWFAHILIGQTPLPSGGSYQNKKP